MTRKFIATGNGCGYWEYTSITGKVITCDDNPYDIAETEAEIRELDEEI